MNTKKIWIISFIFGIAFAGFVYLAIFVKKDPATPAVASVSSTTAEKNNNKSDEQIQKEKTSEEKKAVAREFVNPMVEVSKGKRALSIRVELEQGVSGYIAPNSKVDVVAYETTKNDKTNKEYKSAMLVLENVKVLASGKSSDAKEAALNYETVTVEVTPEEGVVLSLAAKDKDGFYLMLRNSEDTEAGKAGIKQTREVIQDGGGK